MRVVHVVTRTNIGGVSSYLDNLLHGLNGQHGPDYRLDLTLVRGLPSVAEGDYFAHRELSVPVVEVASLRRRATPFHDVVTLIRLVGLFRRLRPDIVHTHMAKAGALGRIAAFVARVPVRVHTFHGHLLQGYFSGTKTRIIVTVERALRRITSHAVVIGERVRGDLVDIGITSRDTSSMIPPAVPAPNRVQRAAARVRLGLPENAVIVGFIGRLAPIKRPDRVVAVARTLPDVHFVIVGEGELSDTVRADASGLDNVSFLGWQDDVDAVHCAIDIALLTSDNEGMSVSLIEAASAGLPIVATNVGAIPEIVHDAVNGLLADTDEQLIAAVRRLADDSEERRRFGVAGAAMAASTFAVARLAQSHDALYAQLLAKKSNYRR
jgi:glycosyltransferase involved in cell wall biosynthesis